MLKFNEYIKEQFDEMLDVEARTVLNQLRGTLERYGILLPASATPQFLDLGAELVYLLGESNLHLYVVYDTNDEGFVDGYAQIVSAEELKDLMSADSEDLLDKEDDEIEMRPSTWYAKRDDDAGNTDEY